MELEFSSQLIETLQTSMGVFVCMGPSGTAGVFLLRGGLVLDHRSVNRVVLHPVVKQYDVTKRQTCFHGHSTIQKKGLALPPKTPSKHFKEEKEREVCG